MLWRLKALYLAVAMLSLYLFPVNCKRINADRNFRHKQNYSWDSLSFGMLRSVIWKLVTNVSGQSVGQIFKGPAFDEASVTKNLRWESFQKIDLIHNGVESWYYEWKLLLIFSRPEIQIACLKVRGLCSFKDEERIKFSI